MSARRGGAQTPRLTRQLVLEDGVRSSDGAGGFHVQWVALGVHWAEVEAIGGRATGRAGEALSLQRYRITLRARPVGSAARPRPDQRLREGARIFTIDALAEADSEGRYLTCFATEERVR